MRLHVALVWPCCSFDGVPSGRIDLQPTDQEGWMLATGGVPQPLLVRFEYRGDRLKVTGLRMESGEPITAAVLRSIPVGKLAAAYTPHLRRQFWDAQQRFLQAEYDAAAHKRFSELLEPMLHVMSGEAVKLTARGRGAKPPTDDEYRAFARIYLEERAVGERGALSRAAKQWGVHRSTALRWLRSMPKGLLEGGRTNDEA
jgi:hypothetical protein